MIRLILFWTMLLFLDNTYIPRPRRGTNSHQQQQRLSAQCRCGVGVLLFLQVPFVASTQRSPGNRYLGTHCVTVVSSVAVGLHPDQQPRDSDPCHGQPRTSVALESQWLRACGRPGLPLFECVLSKLGVVECWWLHGNHLSR